MPKPTVIKEITKEQFKELKIHKHVKLFLNISQVTKQKANNLMDKEEHLLKIWQRIDILNWYEVIN